MVGNSTINHLVSKSYAIFAEFSQLNFLAVPYFDSVEWLAPNWGSNIRGLPLGITWRMLQREWAKKRSGEERLLAKLGKVEYIKAMVFEDAHYIRALDGASNLSMRESIDYCGWLHSRDGKQDIKWSPWPALTEIKFLDLEQLKSFWLEIEKGE